MQRHWVYFFGQGRADGTAAMKEILGGKGAGLAEMSKAGLPVPPGFTITTEACNDYFAAGEQLPAGLWEDVLAAVKGVEAIAGKGFGDPANPLLASFGLNMLKGRMRAHPDVTERHYPHLMQGRS